MYAKENKLKDFFRKRKNMISLSFNSYENMWLTFSPVWDAFLIKFFDFRCSKKITAYPTFFPLFPRDIKNKCFLIPISKDLNKVKSVIAHELLHFAFFSKLRIPYKNISHDLWLASELIVPCVFDYFNKTHNENLITTNYCLTEEKIKYACSIWENYTRDFNFDSLVKNLISIIQKDELL